MRRWHGTGYCDTIGDMSLTLLLSTANEHKKREMSEICSPHTLLVPSDIGVSAEYDETGTTFLENALGKARALATRIGPDGYREYRIDAVIADDSGICVDALEGGPGVYSARYGMLSDGTKLDPTEQIRLMLEELHDAEDRRAHYTCCMTAVCADGRIAVAEERLYGEIARTPSIGTGGFGYDPIFRLPDRNCCVADISNAEKHTISHRGRATRALLAALATMCRGSA